MFVVILAALTVPIVPSTGICPNIVSRHEWGAREPKSRQNLSTPVDMVFIHHSYLPAACHNRSECVRAMRSMQDYHMDDHGWEDIGYSFAVGGDGVYEGRGWKTVGAHTLNYNSRSEGIVFIGDYRDVLPTEPMLSMVKALIQCGVAGNYIKDDYILLGHRQVRDTECPGDALFHQIQTWNHWRPYPPLVKSGQPPLRQLPLKIPLLVLLNVVSYLWL